MLKNLSGSEASRLFAAELLEHRPHGPINTWRAAHAQRVVEELKGKWIVACHGRGVRPSDRLWSLVAEGGCVRALE